MADPKKPYTVSDRRRVGERGGRRDLPSPKGLRQVEFTDLRKPLESAFSYFRAQLEHIPAGATWPRSGEMPAFLRAFVISTEQLYAATILLMAGNRPKPLVLPAGILARGLVEGLGNLFALLEDPIASTPLFLRDDYLNAHRKVAYHQRRFGNRPGYAKEVRNLAQYARALGLSPEEATQPELLKEWPTPGRLLNGTTPPRLVGERRKVFEEVHGFWYRSLSAFSHHRVSALQMAVFSEEQPDEGMFLLAKSATVTLAVLVVLCVLSEVEHFCGFEPNAPLRVAWERVHDMDDLTLAVYKLRYGNLLKMPPPGTPHPP